MISRQRVRRRAPRPAIALALALALAGCGEALPPERFAAAGPLAAEPEFHPDEFFTGRTHSFGVFESRAGAPQSRFNTDAIGVREADGALRLAQTFSYDDGPPQHRVWRLERLDAHRYRATANDVVGDATGEAYGALFHWRYTLEREPGSWLKRVDLEQWMYLDADGTMTNRAVVSRFGVTLAMVTEHFKRLDDAAPPR